jgi:hypothetical protein
MSPAFDYDIFLSNVPIFRSKNKSIMQKIQYKDKVLSYLATE